MFRLDERANVFHRTRAIQSDHRSKVVDRCWFQLFDVLAHSLRFELKHTEGVALSKNFKSLLIVDRDVVNTHVLAGCFSDELHALIKDRQVGETEEVHLEQTNICYGMH